VTTIASIVVPAHNEGAVIAANLRRLLAGTAPDEFDVVVVPNGCTDDTAAAARAVAAEYPEAVRVVETETGGKPHAIRLGDAACRTFPRIYADADVGLTAPGVRALVAALRQPGILAAGPVPELDLTGVGPVARRVHRVHDRMVAPGRALAGVGVYALNEAGHDRVFPMPDVISDDGWVHNSFAPAERVVVPDAVSVVRPARTVRAHLRRRLRVRAGNEQLRALGRPAPQGRLGLRALVTLVTTGEVSPLDAGCYLAVLSLDRSWSRLRGRGVIAWGSDASSRSPAVSTVD
jgi:glycosyltransferase involved in cell wall biosynthesis